MTERQLIEDCLNKKASSQHKLFQLYAGKMLTVCRRYAQDQKEAEDILQDAFIRIFSRLHQYRFEGSLEGWVRRVVVTTALKAVRKRKVKFADIGEDAEELPAVNTDAVSTLGAEELLTLISQLPDGYRLVFNLYVLEGYEHGEIAEMLKITAATSRSQLLKARRLLITQIEKSHKIPDKYA